MATQWQERMRKELRCSGCGVHIGRHGRCDECNEKTRVRRLKRFKRRKSKGICALCKKPFSGDTFQCDECNEKKRNEAQAVKLKVIMAYGGLKCCVPGCQITDVLNLTLNHIDGGGMEHRTNFGGSQGIYRQLIKLGFPPGFNVMCYGHNNALKPKRHAPKETFVVEKSPRYDQNDLFAEIE